MEQLRLIELRKNLGLTQKQVAKEISISRSFYTQIENGNRKPSFDVALKIAKFFDKNVEKIFLLTDITSGNIDKDKKLA